MTFGSLTALILFVYFCYFMMRKGGGCCGGHDHGDHKNNIDRKGHENEPRPPLEQHYAQKESGETGKDPVCGMDVSIDSPASDHRGKTFRFCSEQCRKLFDLNPNKYVNL
ncbi:MAG: YHS domain-containing protein [Desulfobulbaceae bacterium]|nr:YHS domain-containing protein [Desulfobulbaceae bacterium]